MMDFVVGHPRSGTMLLARVLDACRPGVAAHEHLATLTANAFVGAASAYYEGRASRDEVRAQLRRYGTDAVRIDSNWKLTWALEVVREVFPDARILHLVREPHANVAACASLDYYGEAITGASPERLRAARAAVFPRADLDAAIRDLAAWYRGFPQLRDPAFARWAPFERNCAFWAETHRLVLAHAAAPGYRRVRLEDLRDYDAIAAISDFFDLPRPPPERVRALLATRVNDHANLRTIVASLGAAPPPPDARALVDRHCGDLAGTLGYA